MLITHFFIIGTHRCDIDTCVGLSSGTAGLSLTDVKEIGNTLN